MLPPDENGSLRHSRGRTVLTLLLLLHIVLLTLWVFPVNAALTAQVQRWVGPYFSLIGLRQEWSLFAPDPMAANSYVDAQVVLENGGLRSWSFPRLEGLSFADRYSKARYRKYLGWLYRKEYRYAWHDAACYVAKQFKNSPSPPTMVKLIRHWSVIPPIASATEAPEWRRSIFYAYQVVPGDLQ